MDNLIRKAELEDAQNILAVHKSSVRYLCASFYSDKQIDAWTSSTLENFQISINLSPFFIVNECKEKIRGFASLKADNSIWHLYILPEFSKNGVGTTLLEEIEIYLRRKNVSQALVQASLNAIPFYKKNGFVFCQEKNITIHGIELPAVEMIKNLY